MTTTATGHLGPAPETGDARRLYDRDADRLGYVMNLSRVWAHRPSLHTGLFALAEDAATTAGLTVRQRGVFIVAGASTAGDAYCSLAWGRKLAGETDPETAAAVVRGDDAGLDPADRALAAWARAVVRDPNATEPADLEPLRAAGYDDERILAITVFVVARRAFAAVNDALGAVPDEVLYSPGPLRDAVTYGRQDPQKP